MQTKIMYLKGSYHDEALLNEAAKQGYKLQSVAQSQGQLVAYLVREPWGNPEPLHTPRGDTVSGPQTGTIPETVAATNLEATLNVARRDHKKRRR